MIDTDNLLRQACHLVLEITIDACMCRKGNPLPVSEHIFSPVFSMLQDIDYLFGRI